MKDRVLQYLVKVVRLCAAGLPILRESGDMLVVDISKLVEVDE